MIYKLRSVAKKRKKKQKNKIKNIHQHNHLNMENLYIWTNKCIHLRLKKANSKIKIVTYF